MMHLFNPNTTTRLRFVPLLIFVVSVLNSCGPETETPTIDPLQSKGTISTVQLTDSTITMDMEATPGNSSQCIFYLEHMPGIENAQPGDVIEIKGTQVILYRDGKKFVEYDISGK